MRAFSFGEPEDNTMTDGVFILEISREDLGITYLLTKHEEEIVRVHLNLLSKYIDIDDCYSLRHDYSGECSLDCNEVVFLRDEYNAVKTYELIKEKVTEVYSKAQNNKFVDNMLSSLNTEKVFYKGNNRYSVNGTCFDVQVGADNVKKVYIRLYEVYLLLCEGCLEELLLKLHSLLECTGVNCTTKDATILLKLILENNRDELNIGEFYTRQ